MAVEQINPASSSPIKHTQGGQLPDTSAKGTLFKRLKADSSIFKYGVPQTSRLYWVLGGAISILAVGYVYFSRKNRSNRSPIQ